MRRLTASITVAAALAVAPAAARAQTAADSAAIRAAVLDYVDAIYQGDTARIARSVRTSMAKSGFARTDRGAGPWRAYAMTYAQLQNVARTWNREGRVNPRTAPRQVRILDATGQVASAKLVAAWGVDYLHLGRYDGRWMIANVIYEITPPTP